MPNTKFRGNRSTGSGEVVFQEFLPYMGILAILVIGSGEADFEGFKPFWAWQPFWSCGLDAANKLSILLPKEASHKIWF